MRAMSFGDERDMVLSSMLDRLEFAEEQALPFEKKIKERAKESEDVRLLMSIPGVNFYLGSLVSSYIGDVKRFPDGDHQASYLGIVPAEKRSSSINRVGRMSKDGPDIARMALSIMVDTVSKCDKQVHGYYAKAKDRVGGKMAHVLTMKKLVRMIHAMLTKREKWRWEKKTLTAMKIEMLEKTD